MRINTKKISIEGQKFPHQTKFLLALASAKRDSDIFETGDQIIPNRVKNNHLSFGLGSHVCLGSMIARKEMEIGLKPMIHFLKYYKIHAVKPLIWDNQIFMRTLKEAIVTRNKIWFK